MKENHSVQFWEQKFIDEETKWGFEPADSAVLAKDLFLENGIKNILIPGVGYGRNAKVFVDNGIRVTGIEISRKAIELSRSIDSAYLQIHHGSVTDMPFDGQVYDGIFCYALIHLLNKTERAKFIEKCYHQLSPGSLMIFTVISTKSPMFGTGKLLSKNRYQIANGMSVFFYDETSIRKEFSRYRLLEIREIYEPIKHMENEPPLKCFLIICLRL